MIRITIAVPTMPAVMPLRIESLPRLAPTWSSSTILSGIGSARFRILTGRDSAAIPARLALGQSALAMLEAQLSERSYLVGGSCSIADLANFAYTHVAEDAGFRLSEYPYVSAWLDRVRALPGFVDDLLPYPDNARPGASRSIYDA